MSVNKVILVGNTGRDPEVKYLDNGVALAKFTLATNERYKNKNGENVKNTEWHNIVLWNKLAEIAEKYVNKGDMLYIEGKIRTRSYDDKEGNKKYFTEIRGDNMTMLGRKQGADSGGESQPQQQGAEQNGPAGFDQQADNAEDSGDDDLPF